MKSKIVFFDVDGTITHHENGSISDKTKAVIHTLKKKGFKLVAATGRPLSMCQEIKDLGIDTFITANGGYVKHNEKVIHQVPMDRNLVKEIVDFAHGKHGLSWCRLLPTAGKSHPNGDAGFQTQGTMAVGF